MIMKPFKMADIARTRSINWPKGNFHQMNQYICIHRLLTLLRYKSTVNLHKYCQSLCNANKQMWSRNCLPLRSTRVHPRFLVVFVLLDLKFYMYVLQIVVCPFVVFLLPLCCLFFDIRILITLLVSSNSSYESIKMANTERHLNAISTR